MSSIKIRTKRLDEFTLIRTLITHPMETGRRKDKQSGEKIPAHFIQELTLALNGEIVASVMAGPSISKDPYFAFHLKDAASGDKVSITWRDNLGNSDSAESIIR